jgi:predicted transcriptional regulator
MKEGVASQGKLLKKSEDSEAIIRIFYEILYVLKLRGPLSTKGVAACLRIEQRRVREPLKLLERKGFLRSSHQGGSKKYLVVSLGQTFLIDLMTLMNYEKSSLLIENPASRSSNERPQKFAHA